LNHHPVDVSPPKVFGSVSWLVDSSYESYVHNIPFNGWPTRFAWKSIYILERQRHMINTLCFHAKSCQSHAKVGLSCAWFHPGLNLDLLKQPGFRLNLGLFWPIYVDICGSNLHVVHSFCSFNHNHHTRHHDWRSMAVISYSPSILCFNTSGWFMMVPKQFDYSRVLEPCIWVVKDQFPAWTCIPGIVG
jgi:hypothetical protein